MNDFQRYLIMTNISPEMKKVAKQARAENVIGKTVLKRASNALSSMFKAQQAEISKA